MNTKYSTTESSAEISGARAAVILDVDGLMIDSEKPWRQALKDAAAERGEHIDEQILDQMHGRSIGSADELLQASLETPFPIEEVRRIRARAERIVVDRFKDTPAEHMPGLDQLLEFLQQHDNLLERAIGSSADGWWVSLVLGEVQKLFTDRIVTRDQVAEGKPNPQVFLEAARLTGLPPERCIVLGDVEPDVEAGLKAKMEVIQVQSDPKKHTKRTHDRLKIMSSLHEVTAYLKKKLSLDRGQSAS